MFSEMDREILDFERGWWLHPEPKDRTITDVLGLTPGAYYRRLRQLATSPDAAAYDPLTVRRVRRLIEAAV
jgi:hypothetical protein